MIELGRGACGLLPAAEAREWLVTSGLGSYASGTVAQLPTRRYHGLLVASMSPPVERFVLFSKLDETVTYEDQVFELGTTRWRDGTIAPSGYRYVERFRLEGTVPVWTFALGDALLEKRVWMEQGHNTTYVTYSLVRGSGRAEMHVKAFSEARGFHELQHAQAVRTRVTRIPGGLQCEPPGPAPTHYLFTDAMIVRDTHEWYLGVEYAREHDRGLDDVGDQLHMGNITAQLDPGGTVGFTLSTEHDASIDFVAAWDRQAGVHARLIEQAALAPDTPAWVEQLVLAAGQFIVQRRLSDEKTVPAIIAGYPWFADWGRDTMLSLPGLLLRTRRAAVAQDVLRAWAGYLDQGMLPNLFPETGAPAQFNSVDSALLFIDAVYRTVGATDDRAFAAEMLPAVDAIVRAYHAGTRFGIGVDPRDGLLHAGEPGVSVTWMDARVGDLVMTPRVGKPVEVNAFWYHALCAAAKLANLCGRDAAPYTRLAESARQGFARFWDVSEGYCFDVLDGPAGSDHALRPNQLFAVALEHRALPPDQQRAVFDACAQALFTSYGLRTLAPDAPAYRGTYGGPPSERDATYHQGTVWPWLIGPFIAAALNVGIDRATAASYLEPFSRALLAYGLGTLFEIADGDPPHTPNGCIAQAWSVAGTLEAWSLLR